ncbi:MAG: hypothetical protein JST62_10505 [Bacteroidetes bacterium]|nr:hypothetical protein [Bacteroidota bacterium]
MKKYYTILCFLLLNCYFAQGYKYFSVDTVTIKTTKNFEKGNFYAVTAEQFKYYLHLSKKKYKIVYAFTNRCKPCMEKLPLIVNFAKENKDKLEMYYLTDLYSIPDFVTISNLMKSNGSEAYMYNILDDANNFNTQKNKYIYTIPSEKTGKPVKVDRYMYFTQKLAPKHKDYGYSLVLLYNEDSKLIYASTYLEKKEEVLGKLNSYLKE